MRSCPQCSSTTLVSRGSEPYTTQVVRDGRIVEQEGHSQRLTCKGCGKTSSHRDESLALASQEARELIVDTVHRLGQTAAAAELGIPRVSIQRHLARWREAREAPVMATAPTFVLLETVLVRGVECVLVVDLDRETLVEILDGPDKLSEWICSPGRAPAVKVCMPLDAKLSAVVREHLPLAEAMIAPATMRRVVRMDAVLATRTIRRAPETRGRNGMPFPHEMADALKKGVSAPPQWPREASAVLSASRAALEILASPDRELAQVAWPQFEMAARLSPVQRLGRLFATWREPILAGIDNAYVDGTARIVNRARRGIAMRHPSLSVQDLRGFALLDGFESRMEGLAIPGVPQFRVARGRPLVRLLASLGA